MLVLIYWLRIPSKYLIACAAVCLSITSLFMKVCAY